MAAPVQPPAGNISAAGQEISAAASSGIDILCGPLLNYKATLYPDSDQPIWQGSVLIVTPKGQHNPKLFLSRSPDGPVRQGDGKAAHDTGASSRGQQFDGLKLYEDSTKAFWAFRIDVPMGQHEARWDYVIPNTRHIDGETERVTTNCSFVVPAAHQSMRIMFHSCNGFSVGTDIPAYTGPVLWNDVLRVHAQKPFHIMIGGGDQIYQDGVRAEGPLKPWTEVSNPHKRRDFPFHEQLRYECDKYYFDHYVEWYGTSAFATANRQIPQINIWDDHDIIDGFGSYTDHFMRCAVFRGIGGVAYKYYCLFQHHIAPPKTTFTTDTPKNAAQDPHQLENIYVHQADHVDPCFILGKSPGPYVEEVSHSLYARLGANIAFAGIDARTERTRHRINYEATYDSIFERLDTEFTAAGGKIKHLIFLLGVPIAYPRLVWLENILSSPLMGVVRLLNKRFGIAGGVFNAFDGSVDLLDDLDDHYTARTHKKERRDLIHRMQRLSLKHSVRITILGGDVHLAALGRFYSKPKLGLKPENDHRYMANVISSAITNKPPPKAVANLLAKRNRIHHLDHDTDETLMTFFDKDPGSQAVKPASNKVTMPSRNYAVITMNAAPAAADGAQAANGTGGAASGAKDGRSALHAGEEGSGSAHIAAGGLSVGNMPGGLDISINVEKEQGGEDGATTGYGLTIPALVATSKDAGAAALEHRHFHRHGKEQPAAAAAAASPAEKGQAPPQQQQAGAPEAITAAAPAAAKPVPNRDSTQAPIPVAAT